MTAADEEQQQQQGEQRHLHGHHPQGGPSYYGTFQENSGFPQPVHPSQYVPQQQQQPQPGYVYSQGAYQRIDEYAGALPCCGLGIGWCLFIIGFLTFSLPWFIGGFIFLCFRHDPREHVGLAACAIAAVLAILIGGSKGINIW